MTPSAKKIKRSGQSLGSPSKSKVKNATPTTAEVKKEPNSDSEPEDAHNVTFPASTASPNIVPAKTPASTEITWPTKDLDELIRRIEKALPSKDVVTYKSRIEKLDWEQIRFGPYTAQETKSTWLLIQARVRRFRLLREIIDDAKEWITKPWTNFYRGSKSNRHPELPRRPLSSYMLFYLHNKDRVLEDNPGVDMTDLSKMIAEMYKNENKSVKDRFNNLAIEAKRQYDVQLEDFYRNHPELQGLHHDKNSTKDVPQMLKRPGTPFKIFCEDRYKRMQDALGTDVQKNMVIEECKELWKNMNDKKKVFWIDWALEEEGRYLENIKTYKSENPDYVPVAVKTVLTKEERSIKERMAGKPNKPPNSGYSLYSRMMLKNNRLKNVNPKDRMLAISNEWKKISDDEKKEYQERVKHMLEQYKLDFATYLESLPDDKKAEALKNSQPKRKKSVSISKPKSEEPASKKKKIKKKDPSTSMEGHSEAEDVKKIIFFEGEPHPPPYTAYLLFAKIFIKDDPNRLHQAEILWQEMRKEDKLPYRRQLQKLKQEYITEYERFLKSLSQEQLQKYSKVAQWNQQIEKKNMAEVVRDSEIDCSSSSSEEDSDASSD